MTTEELITKVKKVRGHKKRLEDETKLHRNTIWKWLTGRITDSPRLETAAILILQEELAAESARQAVRQRKTA